MMMQFNTEVSKTWLRTLAEEVLSSSFSSKVEKTFADSVLNHLEVRYSRDVIELWATKILTNEYVSDKSKLLAKAILIFEGI